MSDNIVTVNPAQQVQPTPTEQQFVKVPGIGWVPAPTSGVTPNLPTVTVEADTIMPRDAVVREVSIAELSPEDRSTTERQIALEASDYYDEQVAGLAEDEYLPETKEQFISRNIATAKVTTITGTVTSAAQLPTEPKNMEAAMAKIPEIKKNLAKIDTGMYLLEMGKAYGIAPKNVDKIQQNITALMAIDANYRGITDLTKWWKGLDVKQQALLAEDWTPKSNWQLAKEVFYGMPIVSTVRSVQTRGFGSGWTWLGIGTDVLILSPVISKALGAIAAPIKGFVPRVGVAPVGVANIAGSTYKVSKLILLPSKNAVAKFEKLRSTIATQWLETQQKLPSATFKKGIDIVMRDDAIIKQLEGENFRMVEVIENPFTKFTAVEQLAAGQKYPLPWGYVTKRSPSVITYTTPVDEALVKASDIKGLSEIRYGEGGGYGREGQWSKAQFDAETQRVKVANMLEDKTWEITPEVKAALQREKQTAVATATKEKPAVDEKFKTITETKETTEIKAKTGAASETERLENIRRYTTATKKFTGAAPSVELVWAVSGIAARTIPSFGKPLVTTAPEVIETTTTAFPDVQTIIKQANTGNTAVDNITQAAISQALKTMAETNLQNMTDTQIDNMIRYQIENAIRTELDKATKLKTDTKLALELKTQQVRMVETAVDIAKRVYVKIKTTPFKPRIDIFIPIIIGSDGEPLTKEQVLSSAGWKQGFMYKLLYPPYGETDIVNSNKPIPGIPYKEGIKSAYESIVKLNPSGTMPESIKRDMGFMDINIVTDKYNKPKMVFTRDYGVSQQPRRARKVKSGKWKLPRADSGTFTVVN